MYTITIHLPKNYEKQTVKKTHQLKINVQEDIFNKITTWLTKLKKEKKRLKKNTPIKINAAQEDIFNSWNIRYGLKNNDLIMST